MATPTTDYGSVSSTYVMSNSDRGWSDVDHRSFYYDSGFKEYCFRKLAQLEDLPVGWDFIGGPPIDRAISGAAREFIKGLPNHIATRPMIVPVPSGKIQIEWHNGRQVLELEFVSPKEVHYLMWDPEHQVENEDIVQLSDRHKLVDMIRWFMKGFFNG